MAVLNGNISLPLQDMSFSVNRFWGFNPSAVSQEDAQNAEISANNQFIRDMYMQEKANAFNAEQAQLQRDFEERMSSTSYQRAVADMKKAGINPILAISNGGADTPQGASASASGARSSGGNYRSYGSSNAGMDLIKGVIQVASGLITGQYGLAVQGLKNVGQASIANSKMSRYDSKGRLISTIYNERY